MTYDPEARRDTPLALKLKERIGREGPISVAEYMRVCLHDPEYGYYRRMPAIGSGGDFITAPEISQVFGELIGLWCAVVWQQMGSPELVHLVELGPGRGTMMRDALRAARVLPGFLKAVQVHLVESNAHLREVQKETLKTTGLDVKWLDEIWSALGAEGKIPVGPTIVLGNEFLDAMEVGQFIFRNDGWHERCVGLGQDGRLQFLDGAADDFQPLLGKSYIPRDGDIHERNGDAVLFAISLARAAEAAPLAALLLDYGHLRGQAGDTLQSVLKQAAVSPLYAPGEADLTAQVDFEMFAKCCEPRLDDGPVRVDGPVTQAEFLGSLGIVERASRLMAANPAKAGEIETGVARLIAPGAMGSRFKAIGIRSAGLPPLPGFPTGGKA